MIFSSENAPDRIREAYRYGCASVFNSNGDQEILIAGLSLDFRLASPLEEVFIYNIKTDAWQEARALPELQTNNIVTSIGDKVLVVGGIGEVESGAGGISFKHVFQYIPGNGSEKSNDWITLDKKLDLGLIFKTNEPRFILLAGKLSNFCNLTT